MNTNSISNGNDINKRIESFRYGAASGNGIRTSDTVGAVDARSSGIQSFSDVLKTKLKGIKFSAHASTRIKSRNIPMNEEILAKLEKAVAGAAEKGARDSLILMKNSAFIVNIPNRTVVTAMDGNSLNNNIFTNIDSAVLAD
ncbi:MAG TPA: TIGR02530 family flagellar biosynthesis protein [Chitinispirillaceae bacterium]|nr:TIGR02530 family flagellar biosynthesis protein [Chitinispirillaceae bacterium]